MLERLTVRNFKSLRDVTVELPRLSVLFGPNAAGKSNLLDAIEALSWLGNARTLFDALGGPLPVRGHSIEAFCFAAEGLPALLKRGTARFMLDANLTIGKARYRYRIEPQIDFKSGQLSVADEYLGQLTATGRPKGTAAIERVGSKLRIRRKGKPAHPREEQLGLNHSKLSDRSLGGSGYHWLEEVRAELLNWRTYYLEPQQQMREEESPADVFDIGLDGGYIASFLYKLQAEQPKRFAAVTRTLRAIIPSIETLNVELDRRRGTLNLSLRQGLSGSRPSSAQRRPQPAQSSRHSLGLGRGRRGPARGAYTVWGLLSVRGAANEPKSRSCLVSACGACACISAPDRVIRGRDE